MNKRIIVGALMLVALLLAACGTSGSTQNATSTSDTTRRQNQEEVQQPQPQAQTVQRITDPVTEANFNYRQNQQGGITITKYIKEKYGTRDLVIPAQIQGINVTEIGDYAFRKGYYGTTSELQFILEEGEVFESVTIPPTVTAIGKAAFMGRGIKTLNLPEGLRTIGEYAFDRNQLSSVKLPAGITVIPAMAFAHNQLTSIDIPAAVTHIGSGAFGGNKLTEVTIPANVTRINAFAFGANMISKINFSASGNLKEIETRAFTANRLKSVVLPEGLTTIYGYGGNEIDRTYGLLRLGRLFDVNTTGVFGGSPLAYIKIPSTLKGMSGQGNNRTITNDIVPIIEWLQPVTRMIYIGNADAIKVGDNIGVGIDDGFNNFYATQGRKAGIYLRRGQIWVLGTQEEFDALIAEKTK
jgi:hypothetical protein